MQDAVAVTLETGAIRIFFFGDCAMARANCAGSKRRHDVVFAGLTGDAVGDICGADASP